MCKRQNLYHEPPIGTVDYCGKCNHIQIAFGNIAFTFDPGDFCRFASAIREIGEDEMTQSMGSLNRSIWVGTACQGIHLLLRPFEWSRLNDMLDRAETEWKTLQILEMFAFESEE